MRESQTEILRCRGSRVESALRDIREGLKLLDGMHSRAERRAKRGDGIYDHGCREWRSHRKQDDTQRES